MRPPRFPVIAAAIIGTMAAVAGTASIVSSPGCATVKPVTDVIAKVDVQKYAQDALLVVGVLESVSQTINLDPAKRKDLDALFAKTKVAIDAAVRTCDGITELTRAQVDLAFGDFKGLYNDALAILGPYGVRRATPGGRAGAAPSGGFVVPEPLVFGA